MEDWEDNMYDYMVSSGGDDYDYEDEDGEERNKYEDEDDPFLSDDVLKEDNIDFNPDFKQMQQMVGDKGRGTTIAPGASKRVQKSMRSADDIITDQLRGVLSSDVYSDLTDKTKNSIVSVAETTKNISLLHLETLIQAIIWKTSNIALNKKNYADFVKKYGVTDQISLLLYIRMLN